MNGTDAVIFECDLMMVEACIGFVDGSEEFFWDMIREWVLDTPFPPPDPEPVENPPDPPLDDGRPLIQ